MNRSIMSLHSKDSSPNFLKGYFLLSILIETIQLLSFFFIQEDFLVQLFHRTFFTLVLLLIIVQQEKNSPPFSELLTASSIKFIMIYGVLLFIS
jgi:hypothetical protein